MSTVAFKDGILAADTHATSGDYTILGNISKISKCKEFMGGACGSLVNIHKFLKWVSSGADTRNFPDFEEGFSGILVDSKLRVYYVGQGGLSGEIKSPFYAIGSGEESAKGAFVVGATAEEAVQAAIVVDLYTGGSVDTLHL